LKELKPEIIKAFGYRLKTYTPFRNSFICKTNQGIKIIRAVNEDIPNLLFQHSAKEYLYANGFKWIDRFHISDKNAPYYIHDGVIYIMTDWVDGRECDFGNPIDIKKAISNLGYMHKKSKGMTAIEGSRIRYYGDDLPLIFRKRVKEFNTMKKKINRQSHMSDFDILFLKHHKDYEEFSLKAIEHLKKAYYSEISKEMRKSKYICHNDYTYHNLIMVSEGHLYVTHFEKCKYGLPVYDLASVLKKIMKKHGWNIQMLNELLALYNKEFTIEGMKNILISLLIFPTDFWKTCNKYYNSKRAWPSRNLIRKLNSIVEQKENLIEFIRYIDKL